MLYKRVAYIFSSTIVGISVFILLFSGVNRVSASGSITISGPDAATTTVGVATQVTDIQLIGNSASTTPVKLLVTNGTLAFGSVTGLTFTGGQTGSTLQFSGTVANINAALQTLTYTRGGTGTDTLEVSLVEQGEVFFADNGHLYKFISGVISWNSAVTAAQNQTAYGVPGYLATILSQEENDFVADRLQGDGWMGASDSVQEGNWKWVTGPENGTQFWSGAAGGSAVGGNYENWAGSEPNDHGVGEDCGQFYVTNGTWNDLPCDYSISGYVVEFGEPGNLPGVSGKNVSITTVSAPVLNSRTPADNATGIAVEPNLTMVFSSTVVTSTGYIEVRKSSDGSLVEQISVLSAQVSGGGTNTITVNPSVIFDEQTGYYVLVSSTAFTNVSLVGYSGISNSTTWNFTTGDFTAPVITNVTSTPGQTSTTISWSTNELASSRVYFGLTQNLTVSTAESDISPRVVSHQVDLSPLLACTTYFYTVQSRDASGNTVSSTAQEFITTGCLGESIVSASSATSTPMDVVSGGSASLPTEKSTIQVVVPTGVTEDSDSLVIQIHALQKGTVLPNTGMPTGPDAVVGDIVFDVKAIINDSIILDSFDTPVTITYTYSNDEIQGLDESSLLLYHYHNSAWRALDDCTVSASINTISCTSDSFSIFGLFGHEMQESGGGTFIPPSVPITHPGVTPTIGALLINGGAEETADNNVILTINADNAMQMVISEDPNFANGLFVSFANPTEYRLSSGAGMKTVYIKLRSFEGGTLVISDSITLTPVQMEKGLSCGVELYLKNPIRIGFQNNPDDVRLLEKFLNTYEHAQLSVDGFYDRVDFDAVVRWQEKNVAEILTPWGISKGTGYVYTTSLVKIKKIHEEQCASSTVVPPPLLENTAKKCLDTTTTLMYGMQNTWVTIAQELLNKSSYLSHAPTGFFGPLTREAVIKFQAEHGIDRVGYIGPQTRGKLNAIACSVE